MRVIVRRPHAYEFAKDHPGSPIPGIAILDAEGKLVDQHDLKGDDAAAKLVELLKK